MKHRITLSIALVMSIVLLSVMGFAFPVNAASSQTYVADTGLITLGPNQLLRLTVTPGPGVSPSDPLTLAFEEIKYQIDRESLVGGCAPQCSGNIICVCLHNAISQTRSHNLTLKRGQIASIDILQTPTSGEVRGLVHSNSPNMEVNAMIIDISTGVMVGPHVKVFDGRNGGL